MNVYEIRTSITSDLPRMNRLTQSNSFRGIRSLRARERAMEPIIISIQPAAHSKKKKKDCRSRSTSLQRAYFQQNPKSAVGTTIRATCPLLSSTTCQARRERAATTPVLSRQIYASPPSIPIPDLLSQSKRTLKYPSTLVSRLPSRTRSLSINVPPTFSSKLITSECG
jgi:hypothetical protein